MRKDLAPHFQGNLHHAYLIEGEREKIVIEILTLLKKLKIKTEANPDFVHLTVDTFKIEDARNLNSFRSDRGFAGGDSKKIFLISANNFLPEAQNTLLKLFEEPIPDTHFFVVVPDSGALLKTFISRFYLIKGEGVGEGKEAEKFIKMTPSARIDFIKGILEEADEDDPRTDSARSNALNFLNSLETLMHGKNLKDASLFHHIFKVREFLRMPGSSTKMLLESVALRAPVLK